MAYKPNRSLLVTFGKYDEGRKNPPSIAQIPLIDRQGLFYLKEFLADNEKLPNLGDGDRKQVEVTCKAYADFPVRIKCTGKGGECSREAEKIAMLYEDVARASWDKEGPSWKKDAQYRKNPFFCEECAGDLFDERGGRVIELPISFESLEPRADAYLHLDKLFMELKGISYHLIFHEIREQIDTSRMETPSRMVISYGDANTIVNKLLGLPQQIPLFESAPGLKAREIFRTKRTSGRTGKQLKLRVA
jgi:hypothetical protein